MRALTRDDIVIPKRRLRSHKGQNGRVLIVGGSEDYVGACALAGIAALRCGCDLVTIAAPERVAWAISALSPDLITRKMKGGSLGVRHYEEIRELASKADAILVGNGIGRAPGTARLVRMLCALDMPKVIDADALRMVDANTLEGAIVTPHRGELAALLENAGADPHATDPAALRRSLKGFFSRGNVLLRKGHGDVIVAQRRSARAPVGNPGMTRGGTGDVLAGLAAGYYAQLKDPFAAACDAAYFNAVAGNILRKRKKGYTYLASDLAQEMARVREGITRARRRRRAPILS